ncbi:MAG: 16S rRNA (guanine(527)-N(7))-methyltransferase RsmG [Bacteroidales bacterium]|nr:16S rRNA (guanine(527)-N(7))-methyltransferase RsmG [Bacteroidales bacterium]
MQNIEKYFPTLTSRQTEQFSQLGPLYHYWNQQINVISRKDMDHLYLHHILHSLSIARIIRFKPGSVIMDAGTGGGFPGIPLAILFPDVHFILVDSIAKKIRVVDTLLREVKLTNCETRNLRLEALKENVDFVVCRAVTDIPKLFGWAKRNIMPGGNHVLKNGLLALKGGDLREELKPMGTGVKVYNLGEYFFEPYFETKKLVYVPR